MRAVDRLEAALWRRTTARRIYARYAEFTMIPRKIFVANLALCRAQAPRDGLIVECGVWRGGMSAGLADLFPGRTHYLFDSFEGLPAAQEIDGPEALAWQQDKTSPRYLDNCRAEQHFAETAMRRSAAGSFHLEKGWFAETLPGFRTPAPIAILRLDGDWYDSTMTCLECLFPQVRPGGLVIIDDYYTWDGCSRALHDYLSRLSRTERIAQAFGKVAYLVKQPD